MLVDTINVIWNFRFTAVFPIVVSRKLNTRSWLSQ